MLMNVHKRLQVWRDNGVITESDLQKILAFENSHNRRSWIGLSIAGIGVTTLATGVISLIASNWQSFSDPAKIIAYFLLQVGVGLLFLRYEKERGVTREAPLALFALLFWAGIGLFGQVFNLSGPAWQSMLLWCCLAFTATLYSESLLLCSLWCFTVTLTGYLWGAEQWAQFSSGTLATATTTAILLTAFGLATHSVGLIREPLRNAAIVCGIGFLLFAVTPLVNLVVDSRHTIIRSFFTNISFTLGLPWTAIAVAVAVSLARPNVSATVRRLTALLFIATGAYFSMGLCVSQTAWLPHWTAQLLGATGFILVWSIAAAAAAAASMKQLFNFASFVIAVRFIIIYFEVFGSLSTTGIGLIISGAVIIGIGILWNRGRQTVSRTLGDKA